MPKYTQQSPLALAPLPPPPRHHSLKQEILIGYKGKFTERKFVLGQSIPLTFIKSPSTLPSTSETGLSQIG